MLLVASVGPIANLKDPYFQPGLSVCLSVCLWPALIPFSVDWFWRNLVTRTLLWSSLAATIMAQIGRLFENFKKFSKITEFKFQNSGPSFFCVCVSCVLWKKFDSIRPKLTEEIHFEVCPYLRNASTDTTPPVHAASTNALRHASSTEDDPICCRQGMT